MKNPHRQYLPGERVWVQYENSNGTIVAVDSYCQSADVRVDSDGTVVSASFAQLSETRGQE